jgi:hypothetical protein
MNEDICGFYETMVRMRHLLSSSAVLHAAFILMIRKQGMYGNRINQSMFPNSYLEHRASTTHCHQTLFLAATFTPFQFRLTALASI